MDLFPPNMLPPVHEGASCCLQAPSETDHEMSANSIDETLLSLAMAFVPYQMWETPYSNDVALQRGTIFPSLDKPFLGEQAVPQ